jgi:uroporphyrinogen decarboxylase
VADLSAKSKFLFACSFLLKPQAAIGSYNPANLMATPTNTFSRLVLDSPRRLAMPIATYPGLRLTGANVSAIVTNPAAQVAVQVALRQRYGSPFVLSAMDLSAEAEAFGCAVSMSDTEVPTVTGRLVTSLEEAKALPIPLAGAKRTGVYLEAIRGLAALPDNPLVLGGCIGPFSLAARLVGVSEAMEMTAAEPDLMHVLLEKSTAFLASYVAGFKAAGAHAVIMAEPAAGLLSPRSVSAFSSAYIRQIGSAVCDGRFTVILHNCAAKLLHLPAILETGLEVFHFGSPMDIVGALDRVQPSVVLCGNLDPTGVFVQSPPDEIRMRAARLLDAVGARRNFVLSSGCDLPPSAPLSSLDSLYAATQVPFGGAAL